MSTIIAPESQVILGSTDIETQSCQQALDQLSVPIVYLNPDGSLILANKNFRNLVSWPDRIPKGARVQSLLSTQESEDVTRNLKRLESGEVPHVIWESSFTLNGREHFYSWKAKYVSDPHGRRVIQAEGHDTSQQNIDELTGLYNRAYLRSQLDHLDISRLDTPLTVFLMDIDRFKEVNDTYGHLVGDHFMVIASTLIHECFRHGDTVVRWGGDEILALTSRVDQSNVHIIIDRIHRVLNLVNGTGPAENVADNGHLMPTDDDIEIFERITSKLKNRSIDIKEFMHRYPTIRFEFSIGTSSIHPNSKSSFEDHLTEADNNMYQEKDSHKYLIPPDDPEIEKRINRYVARPSGD